VTKHPARHFVRIILFSFFLAALGGCGPAPQSKPLPRSWQEIPGWLPIIEGDEDAKARQWARWVDKLSENKFFTPILDVAEPPRERRSALALYRAGVRAYRAEFFRIGGLLGDRAEGLSLGKSAWSGRIEHEKIPYLYWRSGIQAAEAVLRLSGQGDVRTMAEAALRAEKIWRGAYAPFDKPVGTEAAVEAALHRADLARGSGHIEDSRSWFRFAVDSANAAYPLESSLLRCRIARETAEWISPSELTPFLEAALADAEGLPPQVEDRGLLLVEAARGWQALGQTDKAAATLRKAEQEAGAVPTFFRPMVLAKIGAAWFEAGQQIEAESSWQLAAETAHCQVHPRARVINAVEILLAMGTVDQVPSPAVRGLLDAIARGEGGEMDYGPGWKVSGQAPPKRGTQSEEAPKKSRGSTPMRGI
jgi:hypothetical protein